MTATECPNCRCRDMGTSSGWRPDGEGFRKGSWFVKHTSSTGFYAGDVWVLTHDDATTPATWTEKMAPIATGLAGSIIRDFLTWHAATYLPAPVEPTKDGYVGILASEYGTNHHVYRYLDYDGHAYRIVGLAAGNEARTLSWGTVLQAGTFTAVTS